MAIAVPIITCLSRLYQPTKQSKDSQNSKNDDWRTNRHMSTKTVPTVYQQCTKNRQKTVKIAKITVDVPIVTSLLTVRRIHKAPPQPVRPWKRRVHLAEGSNVLLF